MTFLKVQHISLHFYHLSVSQQASLLNVLIHRPPKLNPDFVSELWLRIIFNPWWVSYPCVLPHVSSCLSVCICSSGTSPAHTSFLTLQLTIKPSSSQSHSHSPASLLLSSLSLGLGKNTSERNISEWKYASQAFCLVTPQKWDHVYLLPLNRL